MPVDIGTILNQWAQYGVFDYLLPFLLIFAIVFGILKAMNIFKNNTAVDAIIALTVAFLSLQWGIVPQFFSTIFPYTGVGLGIILVVIILIGFFVDPSKPWIMYVMLGIAAVVAIFVLTNTSSDLGWYSGSVIQENMGVIAFAIVFIIVIAVIVGGSRPRDPHNTYTLGPWRPN